MDSRQHAPLPTNPVGDLLRGWRNRRAMSQADLAFEAGISIKHLSYVETGKAAGSRDILLQLASALGLSLRDRNALLEAGGFARQYGERDLSAPEVADAKRAIDLLLRRHEPFPAIVTDRRWNVMQANRAAVRLMTMLLGEARMTRPLNHMRMFLAPDELRPFVVDWPDVAAALLARARHEAMAAPLDLALQSTWRELLKLPDVAAPQLNETDAPGPLCEVRLKKGDISIGLIGAVLTLGTPQDVTLQELRVEMFMPADEASEALLVKLRALTHWRAACCARYPDKGRFRGCPPTGRARICASSLLFGFGFKSGRNCDLFPHFGAGSAYLRGHQRAVLNMKEDALGLLAVSRCGFLQLLDHVERLAAHGLTLFDVPDQLNAQVLDIFRRSFIFADNRFRRQLADLRGSGAMLDIVGHRQIRRT